ncbi:NADPH-dependent FMN reductase [Mariniluteicoccus flavus]
MNPSTPALRVLVVIASIREDRIGHHLADWVSSHLGADARFAVDVIDLAETRLPDDRLLEPGGADVEVEPSDRVDAADAFVFVTPEYNRSIPASLKRFLDWHYAEWARKAAMIVPYGAAGGIVAAEHLRSIMGELSVVSVRTTPSVAAPWEHLGEDGWEAPEVRATQLGRASSELAWWASATRAQREADERAA